MGVLSMVLADGNSDFGHMNWGDGGWWMMVFWGPVVFLGLAALVVWAVRSGSALPADRRDGGVDPLDGARGILAERYARGELDSDEYRERVERLS